MMHVSLPLSKEFNLMACDRHPKMHKGERSVGNNYEIALSPDTREETDRLFTTLSKGGMVDEPLQDMFWGSYFGTCVDKYGIKWMFDHASPTEDEAASPKKSAELLHSPAGKANKKAEKMDELAPQPHAKRAK